MMVIFFSFSDAADKFLGNQTHKDYFKLLRTDGTSLLIGARNVVYNLSLPYLVENPEQVSQCLQWNSMLLCIFIDYRGRHRKGVAIQIATPVNIQQKPLFC
jgi:hypothetical protein